MALLSFAGIIFLFASILPFVAANNPALRHPMITPAPILPLVFRQGGSCPESTETICPDGEGCCPRGSDCGVNQNGIGICEDACGALDELCDSGPISGVCCPYGMTCAYSTCRSGTRLPSIGPDDSDTEETSWRPTRTTQIGGAQMTGMMNAPLVVMGGVVGLMGMAG